MNFLLIDDEAFVLKLLTRQLSNLGFDEVIALEQAFKALPLLESDPAAFDIILLDLQMPDMDGVEFVRHLVRIGYLGGLVLISGEGQRILHTVAKLAKAHKLRVLGALQKPIHPEQLKHVIEHVPQSRVHSVSKTYSADELRNALKNNELTIHYQPQVDVHSGQFVGVESLVRWQHPTDGLIYPDHFVGITEDHGLIDDLTAIVLTKSLEQARVWHQAKMGLKVAINVSMDNLKSLDFADYVVSEIKKSNIPLSSIVLEVTESRLMSNPLIPLDILSRLRLKDIELSIDDFGTGHSSLAQLRDIPFDELKIDRGFVQGAYDYPPLRTIVKSSLVMAKHLGMTTVAEGVETKQDWDFIRSTSCGLAQGYFIAKPMSPDEILPWMPVWESRLPALLK